VGVEEVVVLAQGRDGACLDPLLPEARMPEAAEPVLGDVVVQQQLEGTDAGDVPVEVEHLRVARPTALRTPSRPRAHAAPNPVEWQL